MSTDAGDEDEGLVASLEQGVARARVRRRVSLTSGAVAAAMLAGVALLAWTDDGGDGARQALVAEPTTTHSADAAPDVAPPLPSPTGGGSPTPASVAPTVAATTPPPAPYQGRAVDANGAPIPGLFVYALPGPTPRWTETPLATTTDAQGRFTVPCPSGPVLLSPLQLRHPQDGHTPNWRPTYVGGGYLLDEARSPPCTGKWQDTVVPRGGVVVVSYSGPPDCATRWVVQFTSSGVGQGGFDPSWLRVSVGLGSVGVVGLPPATYSANLTREGEDEVEDHRDVTVTGSEQHGVSFSVSDAQCGNPGPSPTSTDNPTPQQTGTQKL